MFIIIVTFTVIIIISVIMIINISAHRSVEAGERRACGSREVPLLQYVIHVIYDCVAGSKLAGGQCRAEVVVAGVVVTEATCLRHVCKNI